MGNEGDALSQSSTGSVGRLWAKASNRANCEAKRHTTRAQPPLSMGPAGPSRLITRIFEILMMTFELGTFNFELRRSFAFQNPNAGSWASTHSPLQCIHVQIRTF